MLRWYSARHSRGLTTHMVASLRLDGASLVGETGCRTFRGRFVVSGEEIRVTELAADNAATAGVCPPAAVER